MKDKKDKSSKAPVHAFSARLRELRKAKGWSQEDLGKRLGVTLHTVSRWERGDHEPGLQALPAIAFTLGVTAYDIAATGLKRGNHPGLQQLRDPSQALHGRHCGAKDGVKFERARRAG